MRPRSISLLLVAALLVAVMLAASAATYEVLGLAASLGNVVKGARGGPRLPGRATEPRPPVAGPAPGEAVREPSEATIAFALTEEDLGHLLRRRDRWLGALVTLDRDASCRLVEGHVAIGTWNRLGLLGLTVVRYPGASDWSLAPVPGGLGVRLNDLRLAGVPFPGAWGLLRAFGRRDDGWVVVPTGARQRLERIEVSDGKLSVAGKVRGRV